MTEPSRAAAKILARPDFVTRYGPPRDGRVVFTNGCFDILHRGHVTYLEQARLLGHHCHNTEVTSDVHGNTESLLENKLWTQGGGKDEKKKSGFIFRKRRKKG